MEKFWTNKEIGLEFELEVLSNKGFLEHSFDKSQTPWLRNGRIPTAHIL